MSRQTKRAVARAKTKARGKKYPWQANYTTEVEKQYIDTLTQGLEQSQSIWELIQGVTVWLVRVRDLERARQAPQNLIVKPGETGPGGIPNLGIN